MGGQQVPGPSEGIGGGLVSGSKDGQRFIPQVLIAQPGARLLITGPEEKIEEIVVLRSGAAALGDESIDQLVHELQSETKFTVARGWHPQGQAHGTVKRIERILQTDP